MVCSSLLVGCRLGLVERRKKGNKGSEREDERLTGNGDTAEAVLVLDSPNIGDSVGRLEAERVGDETVLEPRVFAKSSISSGSSSSRA